MANVVSPRGDGRRLPRLGMFSKSYIFFIKFISLLLLLLLFFYESTVISWHSLVDSCTFVILFEGKIYA